MTAPAITRGSKAKSVAASEPEMDHQLDADDSDEGVSSAAGVAGGPAPAKTRTAH